MTFNYSKRVLTPDTGRMEFFEALVARLNPSDDQPSWQQTYADEIAAIRERSEELADADKAHAEA